MRPRPAQSSGTHHALVVGAGPGGLAAAARLREIGLEAVLLEQGDEIATKWRNGYDCLRLNTSSWFSYLPGERFPWSSGRWVSRDELVAYYRDYASSRSLSIRTGVRVERLDLCQGGWRVTTSEGPLSAEIVVIATGMQHTPVIPDWPGISRFEGELIHSASYCNPRPFRGRDVLVVGTGNSGADVSLDLAGGGAARVWLSARRPPHIIPREIGRVPHDLLGVVGRHLPRRVVDVNARLLRRLAVGDLSELGLPIPRDGAVTRFEEEGRVPTIDSGELMRAIGDQRITVVAGVRSLAENTATLADGVRLTPEAIVAATGYRPNLDQLVGHLGVLSSNGFPVVHGGKTHPSAPNLYFSGFSDPRSGQLRELRLQAMQIARAVNKARPRRFRRSRRG